jgi:hypothetical protein
LCACTITRLQCACTITRLHHTLWVVAEGYVKLENWRSDTFLSVPSTRYKLMHSTSYSEVPVILVTLTLILFLFSYFEQTNHESCISVVWDVTLCRVCDSGRFKERHSIIFKAITPKKGIASSLPMTALPSVET